MIDDQVNLEELEESKKRRGSQESAAKDDVPVPPKAPAGVPPGVTKQWLRDARKWFGAGGRSV
ncbi:hypothetical protein [Paraburkholderia phenazinium]|jgi:hypothetical protein|uniref:Uncharacterized protein n=1 Tax=Paraburkholderia phenazinium TaxID=60549 RepID=A0A1G7SBS0_9BURK|nr:hypothetical protein [Paraburkholderia phenazinium]SDG20443.1 hypothetical protein SAMN05216466_102460 [Paraburkholderia phenazinium]